jgi:hypothetical protein
VFWPDAFKNPAHDHDTRTDCPTAKTAPLAGALIAITGAIVTLGDEVGEC